METPENAESKRSGLITLGIALVVLGAFIWLAWSRSIGIALILMGAVFLAIGWKAPQEEG